jgi:hypothetical protein
MELVNQELQLQSGETDVTRGLVALNVAQDYFETLAAGRGKGFGSVVGTVTTTNATETTAFPSGLLRLDRMQVLDSNSRPKRELVNLKRAGGHAVSAFWPLNVLLPTSSGEPYAYWTDGTTIYWNPLPNATHTIRYYGFKAATDITAGDIHISRHRGISTSGFCRPCDENWSG